MDCFSPDNSEGTSLHFFLLFCLAFIVSLVLSLSFRCVTPLFLTFFFQSNGKVMQQYFQSVFF